ncbi:hypothetical protein RN001_005537 [Aquatica leii]|uniref:Uncharacterized protein n=1 Tax=Aquatica leii TaxID=1421715 RepID=A0AAN7PCU3_9COLE|nr:hypothetical protein RN001_005537 [Aquatica leii]
MPRKRVLKTNRVLIDEANMKQAIIKVFNGTYSERRAAIIYEIRRTILQCRIKRILSKYTKESYLTHNEERADDSGNDSIDEDSPKYSSKYTVRQVFTNDQELELVKYIKRCSDINYGLTFTDVQKLAYEYANILPHCKIPAEWHATKSAKDG